MRDSDRLRDPELAACQYNLTRKFKIHSVARGNKDWPHRCSRAQTKSNLLIIPILIQTVCPFFLRRKLESKIWRFGAPYGGDI